MKFMASFYSVATGGEIPEGYGLVLREKKERYFADGDEALKAAEARKIKKAYDAFVLQCLDSRWESGK